MALLIGNKKKLQKIDEYMIYCLQGRIVYENIR